MPTLYTVSFDRMFGSTDAGGKWVVRGQGFAPLVKADTKGKAVREARKLATPQDTIEVRKKGGELQRSFSPQS